MEINIILGTEGNQTKIAEKKDTAIKLGSGNIEVFATPAMIALMEETAYKSIEKQLPIGFTSVGIEINTKHLKASLPGQIITCTSKVVAVDGLKVSFEIEANDNKGLIGKANHDRFIVNTEKFMGKLKQD